MSSNTLPAFQYVTTDKAWLYRPLMRVFSDAKTRFALHLRDGRIEFVSDCWCMRYRDAEGVTRRGSTGCREKQAALKKLTDSVPNRSPPPTTAVNR